MKLGFYAEISLTKEKNKTYSFNFESENQFSRDFVYTDSKRGVTILGEIGIEKISGKDVLNLTKEELGQQLITNYLESKGDFLQHLSGEFSFCLIDHRNEELNLYRDIMGIIPMFWSINDENLYFSPCINLLEQRIKRLSINKNSLINYLNFLPARTEETFYNEINRLDPMHSIKINSDREINKLKNRKFLNIKPKSDSINIKKLNKDYQETLRKSVKIKTELNRLENKGIMLSGGLDSSAIASILRKDDIENINSFSVTFPHIDIKHKNNIDESGFQDQVNKAFNFISNSSSLEDPRVFYFSQKYLGIFGEPFFFFNLYIFDWVYSRANEKGVRLMFDGHDGDTSVSHGYEFLKELLFKLKFKRLIQVLSSYSKQRNRSFYSVCYQMLILGIKSILGHNPKIRKVVKYNVKDNINLNLFSSHLDKLSSPLIGLSNETGYLLSRSHEIIRSSPFFENSFLEHSLSLPSSVKFGEGQTRHVLREAFKKELPEIIYKRLDKANLTFNLLHKVSKEEESLILREFSEIDSRLENFLIVDELKKEIDLFFSQERDENALLNTCCFFILNIWLKERSTLIIK